MSGPNLLLHYSSCITITIIDVYVIKWFMHTMIQYIWQCWIIDRDLLLYQRGIVRCLLELVMTFACTQCGDGFHTSRVSCQNGPPRHVNAWQIGPFWQDTIDMPNDCKVMKDNLINILQQSHFIIIICELWPSSNISMYQINVSGNVC